MTVSYSTNLGLALPAQGDWAGSWGTNQNQFITQYLDAAIAGAQVISGSQTAVTLSTTNGLALSQAGSGATGSAQYAVINCTGNPASMLTITAPLTDKTYVIINATSTSQAVKIVGIGPTTGVTVAAARAAMVAWNGTDFVLVATTDASKLAGTLAVANGGTGQTTYTNGELLIGNSTGNTLTKANLTAGTGIAITNGTGSITVGGAAATSSDIGMVKLGDAAVQSVAANAVTATASRTYALQVNASGQGVINVPWTDTVYSLPAATDSVLGGIKLGSATQQTTAANAVTATASRTYALQVNASGQGLVNVPWTDTTYILPTATDSVLGGIKLGDATVQSVAANAVTATASRTYALQLNSGGQAVVNVPWTDTSSTPPAGANTQIQFNNSGSFGGSADFIFNGSQVGILNASPAATLDVGGNSIIGSTTAGAGITIFRRATIPTSGSTFGNIIFASTVDGTTLQIGGSIIARASEAWTGSGTGTRLVFRTATNGVVGPSDKMTLENNGDLAVTGAISAAARLVSGVGSVASAATITPTSDTVNQYNVTALAVPATIEAPSGTPVDGQKLIIRLKDNGTAQALAWNAIYRAVGTTLPTTTVANKTTYVGCIYNSDVTKWDVVAVVTQG